eukprot:2216549-Heterocapsa_arctica.AAC.1
MDRNEWGQFEHIIMWSKIYRLKVKTYSYSMNMQTIYGDEFMNDKVVIRLLYCNKSKWGDAEHHYDLMYPIPQHICNNKCYDKRSDEEQTLYQTNENTHL